MERSALEEKFQTYQFIVFQLAKKYHHPLVEWDDLVQSGNLGLLKALRTYPDTTREHFIRIATRMILHELSEQLRMMNHFYISKSFYRVIQIVKKNQDKTFEALQEEYHISKELLLDAYSYLELRKVEEVEVASSHESIFYGLNSLEKSIVLDRFYFGHSKRKIAQKYHITSYRLDRILKEICHKIKNA